MNILVTGASGFVGKCLTARLMQIDIDFVACSRRWPVAMPKNYVVNPDFNDELAWHNLFSDCDTLIHLAARVHVMQEKSENPLQAFLAVNLQGTVHLAQAAAKAGVKRFVFVSSIKVNGEFTENQPFTESDLPKPQDAYAISKWEAEKALRQIEKETGMEVVIVRPPLVYGAGVKANFASLLKAVCKKIPLPLGSVRAERSLIYIGNLVDAIIVCASTPKAAGQTYLVSDGEDVAMPKLIKKIAQALNKPSYVLPFPVSMMRLFAQMLGKLESLDRLTQSLVIDSSKIRQELGWKPPFTMDQGLKATADWYLKSLENDRV